MSRRKLITITYSKCVHCPLWPVWLYSIFSHFHTNCTIFGGKKYCSLQILSETFLILRTSEDRTDSPETSVSKHHILRNNAENEVVQTPQHLLNPGCVGMKCIEARSVLRHHLVRSMTAHVAAVAMTEVSETGPNVFNGILPPYRITTERSHKVITAPLLGRISKQTSKVESAATFGAVSLSWNETQTFITSRRSKLVVCLGNLQLQPSDVTDLENKLHGRLANSIFLPNVSCLFTFNSAPFLEFFPIS